ncbi:hypothetical protein PHLGIDRAFT_297865 [Phlebiopsis gigantea 11061_1 CR5-6]|uniref:Uncharacterized protein n=1 Tax=Phlebiopsis gigantea (strain 11061_1 CR5-6) TaxID=745531 RepID=A0A0C3RR16_PHLG1|nr:hypothetical protein PHLGIDRAFT_297865 [Phlebiopsis gigantea 11061_1 CR5-6]
MKVLLSLQRRQGLKAAACARQRGAGSAAAPKHPPREVKTFDEKRCAREHAPLYTPAPVHIRWGRGAPRAGVYKNPALRAAEGSLTVVSPSGPRARTQLCLRSARAPTLGRTSRGTLRSIAGHAVRLCCATVVVPGCCNHIWFREALLVSRDRLHLTSI